MAMSQGLLALPALPVAAGAAVYLIYKRYEPSSPASALFLLCIVPAILIAGVREHYSSLLAASFGVYAIFWATLAAFIVAYRLSPFHPLAGYPGPLLCRVSKGWLAYIVGRSGKTHLYIRDLHLRYGDVVRIGPNELSVTAREFTEAIGPKGLPKGPYYETRNHKAGTSLNAIRDSALHAVRRRPWARGMNSASMKYYEELVRETVGDLVDGLKQRKHQRVDFSEWMTYFGFDFMGHMAFTHDYGLLKNGFDQDGLTPLVELAMRDVAWTSHVSWAVEYLKWVPNTNRYWPQIKALGVKTVKARVARGSTHHDLFYHLMDEEGHEKIKPDPTLVAIDGQLAIIAGGDTTATALSQLFYFLLRHPEYLERLRKEVDEALPQGEGLRLDISKQASMPFLNACINEALRLYPPVLSSLQRRVEPGTGGYAIGTHFIPEQTQVSFHAYTIHRDAQYFSPLTDTFWPDRWLSQDAYLLPSGDTIAAADVVTTREVFFPFSQGPTVCAGKTLALTEIRSVTCALLQTFDIKIADEAAFDAWEGVIEEMFTTRRSKLPVQLTLRS